MKIRVNKQLSVPYSGTENPSTNKTIKLQSKSPNGNLFVVENTSAFGNLQTATEINGRFSNGGESIKEVYLADTISSLTNSAFSYCTNLSSIELPAGLKSIGALAFNGCSKLSSIEFPAGLKSIGALAFNGCSKLSSIEFPDGLSCLNGEGYIGGIFGGTGLTSVTIPESVTILNGKVFDNCSELEFISAMNSCDIGSDTFPAGNRTHADTLKRIYLKNQAVYGDRTFGCYTYVHVSPTVEEGEEPVEEDPSLSALQIYYFDHLTDAQKKAQKNEAKDNDGNWLSAYQIPVLQYSSVYSRFQNYDIHVPTALYDKWIAADNWNSISSHIYPYSEVTYVDGTMEMELDPNKTYIVADNIASVAFTATPTQHVEYEEQEVTDPETGEPSTVQVEKMVNDTVSATAYDIANPED